MGFQKCPVCSGTGKSVTEFNSACHVCQGYGIISDVTGEPPKKVVTTNTSGEDFGIFIDQYVNVRPMPKPDWVFRKEYGVFCNRDKDVLKKPLEDDNRIPTETHLNIMSKALKQLCDNWEPVGKKHACGGEAVFRCPVEDQKCVPPTKTEE